MKVSDKYNSLAVFESRITRRKKTYPVHKKLDFGKSGSAKICEDINDWLAERYMPPENSRILDAGCGNGKTLFTFCRIKNITGMGISQSEVEISLAKKMAEALGYDQVCTFAVKNYDEPLHERFDLIMAIESLKHSKNLGYTVSNLCSSLNQEGLFIVVEDLLSGSFQEGYFRKLLMKHWSLQELYLEDDYHAAMHHQELQIKEMTDLTDMVPRRRPRRSGAGGWRDRDRRHEPGRARRHRDWPRGRARHGVVQRGGRPPIHRRAFRRRSRRGLRHRPRRPQR